MTQKLALLAASLAATLVLVVGLAAAGFAPQAPAVDATQAMDVVSPSDATVPVQVDTIYVVPAQPPAAPAAAPANVKETIFVEHGDDHEGGHEAGDD
jgi:hypothetical protein